MKFTLKTRVMHYASLTIEKRVGSNFLHEKETTELCNILIIPGMRAVDEHIFYNFRFSVELTAFKCLIPNRSCKVKQLQFR